MDDSDLVERKRKYPNILNEAWKLQGITWDGHSIWSSKHDGHSIYYTEGHLGNPMTYYTLDVKGCLKNVDKMRKYGHR